MPCDITRGSKLTVFICGRGRRVKACIYCGKASSKLCDFPVVRKGKKTTCDAPLCEGCALKGKSPDVDFCRPHYKLAAEAAERRATSGQNVQK
jgi:hypothetical protein